ncbi:MAG: dihydrodipicolinate synthase family protein [Eubacteriales bacterium]|nr:dihydrodipicolinate synthase family protein [Eubacteriales bacterium]
MTYPGGVWPVMLTPYTKENQVDANALEALVNWYIGKGVSGLFSSCQSSENHMLTLQERVLHTKTTVKAAAGRVPVVASGHVADDLQEQLRELSSMAEAGADAVILVTNHLAKPDESDAVWIKNLEWLMNRLDPSIHFGLYECPHPYKRLMSEETLRFCAQTGRFYFLKDTCCDAELIAKRVQWVQGTNLRLYNANATTVLDTLLSGAAGFSGIMANFHPELYVWLTANPHHPNARAVQDICSICSLIEGQWYPVNAKYHLREIQGLPMEILSRVRDWQGFTPTMRAEVHNLHRVAQDAYERLCR